MKSRPFSPVDLSNVGAPVVTTMRRRRRWSAPERAAVLAQFAASGLSAAAFCRAAGLCAVTFSGWRRRHAAVATEASAAPATRFATVQVGAERPAQSRAAASCVVQLPNGIRITVTSPISPAWLGAVLSHLR